MKTIYYVYDLDEDKATYFPTKATALAHGKTLHCEVVAEKIATDNATLCDILNGVGGYSYGTKIIATFWGVTPNRSR
jgi:hypothetical protein